MIKLTLRLQSLEYHVIITLEISIAATVQIDIQMINAQIDILDQEIKNTSSMKRPEQSSVSIITGTQRETITLKETMVMAITIEVAII